MSRNYNRHRPRGRRYSDHQTSGGGLFLVIVIFGVGLLLYSLSKGETLPSITSTAKSLIQSTTGKILQNQNQPVESKITDPPSISEKSDSLESKGPYAMPCTQANIAKILVYTLMDSEKQGLETSKESDNAIEAIWYKKYYDLLSKDNRFSFFQAENALKPVSYNDVSLILENVLGEGYGVRLQGDDASKNDYIAIKDFLNIYEQALEQTGKGLSLEYKDIVILETPATNVALPAWRAKSDQGEYGFEGLIIESFKNTTIRTAVKNGEILGIVDMVSEESSLKQCYVVQVDNKQAKVRVGDAVLTFSNKALTKKDEETICDIVVDNKTIISAQTIIQKNSDKVIRITDQAVYFERAGKIAYDKVSVYDETEKGDWKNLSQIPYGTEVEYLLNDNKLESLKITNKKISDKVRVVVSTNEFGDYLHDNVQLISVEEYDVVYNGTNQVLPKEKSWDANKFSWEKDKDVVRFVPKKDSLIKILSTKRQGVNPKYKGELEIFKEPSGKYVVVNELEMEDYVAAVISSEMPTSFGIEATKVQAVAARSYAKIHQGTTNYVKYGAQLDDTTATQVYNNVQPDEIAYKAAKETVGEVLLNSKQVISGNFFSTSCGYTANYGEVWASGEIFPTNTPVYLVSRQQYLGDPILKDFNNEKENLAFFKSGKKNIDAFDEESPWFRWQLKLSHEEIKEIIDYGVAKLSKESPNVFKVLGSNGKWINKEISSVGNIKDIVAKKRGEGGNIMELVIKGDKYTIRVSTEYAIRNLLAPVQRQKGEKSLVLERVDGSTVKDMLMLPSAFFSPEITRDKKGDMKNITLYGGGFGHGVGMSQEGVRGMVKKGYTYKEILSHYYPNVTVGTLE